MTNMSEQSSHLSFGDLPFEIRQLIWGYTIFPRVITLVSEAYSMDEDVRRAVPWYLIESGRSIYADSQDPTKISSARFSINDVLPHVALQVSQESRQTVMKRGYKVWKIENREGQVKSMMWHPDIDIILFPEKSPVSTNQRMKVVYTYYPKIFALQYPDEMRMARKVALYTSQCLWGSMGSFMWVCHTMGKFTSLNELVLLVDNEAERIIVQEVSRIYTLGSHPVWKVPQDVEELYKDGLEREPDLVLRVPSVRVVESVEKVLSDQNLEIRLRCNPCGYLGMGS